MEARQAVAPGLRLAGRYRIERSVAAGGMATIWSATDEVLARTVAIKTLRPELADDPAFLERFQHEAVSAARLNHPNIISVFDTGDDAGVSFIVMEYFDGKPLDRVLEDRGPLDPAAAVEIMSQVLEALGFAHSMGVIHRDVKPGNMLVGSDGRVKVTDFGIATAVFATQDLTTTGAVLGTVRYLSPEQVQEADVDGRSDLYAAGLVLYELLTGRPAFSGENDVVTALMRLRGPPPAPRAIRPGISRGLEAVVMRSIAIDPNDRYQGADAMRLALVRHAGTVPRPLAGMVTPPAGGGSVRTSPPPVTAPSRGSSFRSWWLMPSLILLVAVAAIAALVKVGHVTLPFTKSSPGPTTSSPSTTPRAAVLHFASVKDFDPQGDGSEQPNQLAFLTDGNTSSTWSTDMYNTAAFGNLKQGLGLWIDFGRTVRLSKVIAVTPLAGWTFQLFPGSAPDPSGHALAGTNGSTTFTAKAGRTVITVPPVSTRGVLVWITHLAPEGGRFAASIAELGAYGFA
jgi:serine/threonine-protein kinase